MDCPALFLDGQSTGKVSGLPPGWADLNVSGRHYICAAFCDLVILESLLQNDGTAAGCAK